MTSRHALRATYFHVLASMSPKEAGFRSSSGAGAAPVPRPFDVPIRPCSVAAVLGEPPTGVRRARRRGASRQVPRVLLHQPRSGGRRHETVQVAGRRATLGAGQPAGSGGSAPVRDRDPAPAGSAAHLLVATPLPSGRPPAHPP